MKTAAYSENWRDWLGASRPKTLVAAVIPVLLGSAIAWNHGVFDVFPAFAALFCAILIQVGTNFANDYFDFKKGADGDGRIGFVRFVASGRISPESMYRATWIVMAIAFFAGLYLVWHAGWIVLVIGVASLLFGYAYTGGPYPLGYNGLGDLFVFVFFGLIAVMTTYYVQALTWSAETYWAALAAGALSTNILVVNNLRDLENDRLSGKRTLGVMFGESMLKWEFTLLLVVAFAVPPHFFVIEGYSVWVMGPFLTLPLAGYILNKVWKHTDKQELNRILELCAVLLTLFGVLLALGILFD